MGKFNIHKANPDTGPIATDEEMHRYLESMNFRIAWEDHVSKNRNTLHNIVLYFDPFPLKYLNYVRRFGLPFDQKSHKRRSGHFPARCIKIGLMVKKRNFNLDKCDTLDYNLTANDLDRIFQIRKNNPQCRQFNLFSASSYKKLIPLLTKRYDKYDLRKHKIPLQSHSNDVYYIPYGGVYDYGGYHMSAYFKRTAATIDTYGDIRLNSGVYDIKRTPEKYITHSKSDWVGRNHVNKAFYMKLSVNDAARGFVIFPDVDRNIAKLFDSNYIYNLIKDDVVESIIGFIDHMESVIYWDDNEKKNIMFT